MSPEVFPADFASLRSTIVFHQLEAGQKISLGDLNIRSIELHHPGKAYAYRVDSPNAAIVLATDGEYKRLDKSNIQHYLDFYQEADLLIFDAQFSMREAIIKEDWGHSSALIGADIARMAKIKQLVLFHHDPTASDAEILQAKTQAQEYLLQQDPTASIQIDVAREGWEIDFSQSESLQIEIVEQNSAYIYIALA